MPHIFSGKKNNASTSLSAVLLAGDSQITIQAGEQNKMPQTFPFWMTLHYLANDYSTSEIVQATAYVGGSSNNSYVIVRGQQSTVAQDWDPSLRTVIVENLFTVADAQEYEIYINSHTHDGVDSNPLAANTVDAAQIKTGAVRSDEIANRAVMFKHLALSGVVLEFAGVALPTGSLWADGAVYDRSVYPELFAVIGTSHNTGGETSSQFRVPNRKGRHAVGLDASQPEFATVGQKGGIKTTDLSHSHSISGDGNHNHTGGTSTNGQHDHYMNHQHHGWTASSRQISAPGVVNTIAYGGNNDHRHEFVTDYTRDYTDANGNHSHVFTTDPNGSHSHGGATGAALSGVSLLAPYEVCNYIIII